MNWFDTFAQAERVRWSAADKCLVRTLADVVFSIYWPLTSDRHGGVK